MPGQKTDVDTTELAGVGSVAILRARRRPGFLAPLASFPKDDRQRNFWGLGVCVLAVTAAPLIAQNPPRQASASKGQRLQQAALNDVPRCSRKLGTISIVDGQDSSGWTQNSLAPPARLLRVLVQRSGCFNIVDRGAGLDAASQEREIVGGRGLQGGSNVGQGQIKAADYVLVAEIQGANSNVSDNAAGAVIGGLVSGMLGGIGSHKAEANTVLSLTNVRTTETLAVTDGYAAKRDTSLAIGGAFGVGGVGAGAVGGGYENTDMGRIVTLAFIQAYSKLVSDLGLIRPGDTGTAEAAPYQTFTARAPVAMRADPLATGKKIRTLSPGATLFPTGNMVGLWWQVEDEEDNVGWVIQTQLSPSGNAPRGDAKLTSVRNEMKLLTPGDATPTPIVNRAGPMMELREFARSNSRILKRLHAGSAVNPTGRLHADWIEVTDAAGTKGWMKAPGGK